MRLHACRLAPFACIALLAACGDNDDTQTNGNGNGNGVDAGVVEPEGEHHTYVVDNAVVPEEFTQANEVGLDLDGDGEVDNALGDLISGVGGLLGDVDLEALVAEQFQEGTLILLADLQAPDLDEAPGAGFWLYVGDEPSREPCEDDDCGRHLDGETSFSIHPDSPTDTGVTGSIAGGAFVGGPGIVSVTVDFVDELEEPLNLELVGARVEIDEVTEDGLASGRLGGGITAEQVESEIIPALTNVLNDLIDEECEGPGEEPEPCGCPDDGDFDLLATLIEQLEAEDTCVVEEEDVQQHQIVSTFLSPDVDLLDEDGNFDPTPGDEDGRDPDSISLGVGFSAVPAEFDSPQDGD